MTSLQILTFELTHENKICSACPNDQHKTRFENRVQFQGSRREKILEGTKLGQMECTEVLRPRDGLPEHFGI